MKKGSIILGSIGLMALTGYGAWCIYKKVNPECANDIKNGVKKTTRKVGKSIEDMM